MNQFELEIIIIYIKLEGKFQYYILLQMGKTKQIGKKTIKGKKVKSEEEEKVDSEYAQEHSPEDPESPQLYKSDLLLFSESFQNRLKTFQDFFQDYLKEKLQGQNIKSEEEYSRLKQKVSYQVEKICAGILEKELIGVLDQIKIHQGQINKEVQKIDAALDLTKKNLEESGCFGSSEIQENLKLFSQKKDAKKQMIAKYEKLTEDAKRLSEVSEMEEEQKQK